MNLKRNDLMLPKSPPYRLSKCTDRYVRTIMCNPPQWNPSVILKTTINAEAMRDLAKQRKISINAFLVKALAIALSKHPRLNYFSFWGKLVWAGDTTKVAVVREGAIS